MTQIFVNCLELYYSCILVYRFRLIALAMGNFPLPRYQTGDINLKSTSLNDLSIRLIQINILCSAQKWDNHLDFAKN